MAMISAFIFFPPAPVIKKKSAPGLTRTGDLRIRNPSLYPPELQGQQDEI